MPINDEISVFGDWFYIHFVENNGMAFGLEFGGKTGKLVLSIFRIIAVFGIVWYWLNLIKKQANKGLIISISLILAGAAGNILDSTFYGLIFSDSTYYEPAVLFPEGGGYASLFHGKVVDMFYFPIIEGYYPDWVPIKGGDPLIFFRPVFNIADSSITIGVALILIFQKRYFKNITDTNKSKYHAVADNIDV